MTSFLFLFLIHRWIIVSLFWVIVPNRPPVCFLTELPAFPSVDAEVWRFFLAHFVPTSTFLDPWTWIPSDPQKDSDNRIRLQSSWFPWNPTLTFRVDPLGPISRCRRFTKRSLFRTSVPILMMSHAMSSCKIRTAWRAQRDENDGSQEWPSRRGRILLSHAKTSQLQCLSLSGPSLFPEERREMKWEILLNSMWLNNWTRTFWQQQQNLLEVWLLWSRVWRFYRHVETKTCEGDAEKVSWRSSWFRTETVCFIRV